MGGQEILSVLVHATYFGHGFSCMFDFSFELSESFFCVFSCLHRPVRAFPWQQARWVFFSSLLFCLVWSSSHSAGLTLIFFWNFMEEVLCRREKVCCSIIWTYGPSELKFFTVCKLCCLFSTSFIWGLWFKIQNGCLFMLSCPQLVHNIRNGRSSQFWWIHSVAIQVRGRNLLFLPQSIRMFRSGEKVLV